MQYSGAGQQGPRKYTDSIVRRIRIANFYKEDFERNKPETLRPKRPNKDGWNEIIQSTESSTPTKFRSMFAFTRLWSGPVSSATRIRNVDAAVT